MSFRGRLIRAVKIFLDVAVLAGAFCLAFLARFEGALPEPMVLVLLACLPWVVLVKFTSFALLGVPRLTWRYVSLVEAKRIGLALVTASLGLLTVRTLAAELGSTFPQASRLRIPLGVLLIDLALSVLGSLGIRVGIRLWTEHTEYSARTARAVAEVPTLLVGVGRTGAQVAAELAARPDTGIHPLGFLDDDPANLGTVIHGIPVLGPVSRMWEILEESGAGQVLITTSDLPGNQVREVLRLCESHGITTKIVPDAGDTGGIVNLSRVRNVAIEDLLRRAPVRLSNDTSVRVVQGRRLVITGAGGSIGSELCRQVCRLKPKTLLLVEQGENSLFSIHRQLSQEFPAAELVPCIADICDRSRMKHVFSSYRPEVVFHAAAHKHVPLMEENPGEAVKNNVLGTKGLADLADACGVGAFMMISTDKAVNPSSVMGVSKRIAELYIQALAQKSPTRFLTVRFGNVLGSSGSVLPIFQEQIRKGGPVTVTHPEMKRYFMTIPEACQLVLETIALGHDGEIFILDMGEPVKIVDLARDLIRLSGLRPDKDIEIQFTGIRPGEKLFEELSLEEEGVERTRHPRIYIGRARPREWMAINRQVEALSVLADSADLLRIHAAFKEIVPEYTYQPHPVLIQGNRLRTDLAHLVALAAGHLLERDSSVAPLGVGEDAVLSLGLAANPSAEGSSVSHS